MDKIEDEIHKVLTHKSGNFVFSRRYDRQAIGVDLKVFHARYDIIRQLPILPSWASALDAELIRKSIFSTAAIEGNPLDEAEVERIILRDGESASPEDFEREILNLKEAHARFIAQANPGEPLRFTEELIQEVHAVITAGLRGTDVSPGRYRNESVKVGNPEHGGTYVPPKIREDIKTLMREFVAWINSPELLREDPLIRAAVAHYHLGKIHPFRDGNGRTARMIEAMILAAAGYKYLPNMLWNYYYKNIHDYFITFTKTEMERNNSIQPFFEFYISTLRNSLDALLAKIVELLKPILLKNYLSLLRNSEKRISQRQYELALLLIDKEIPFNASILKSSSPFSILYKNVSEKTVQRDIAVLMSYRVFIRAGGFLTTRGKFKLNRNLMRLDTLQLASPPGAN